MKIHFIAIGGSAMHNLAIALNRKGYTVTGSDDEIFEPSRSRLDREGILPQKIGWDEANISEDLDAVVLGMHAREDNPELRRAKKLSIPIYSYPEYVYEQTKYKKRIVIGGSHGKTTITSMILHVLNKMGIETDYLVGAQLDGYDCMVRLSETSEYAVIEGDEYLSSPIDRRPKFHLYRPDVAVVSGIAWDHINVFPTLENYVEQFRIFADLIEKNGSLIYYSGDEHMKRIVQQIRRDIELIPYDTHPYIQEGESIELKTSYGNFPVQLFGEHNLQNVNAAREVLKKMGLDEERIYKALTDFRGASKRMELVLEKGSFRFYKDFAHAPSKLMATTRALKSKYPNSELVACMELHTFSSLNKDFLPNYDGCMESADKAYIYFSPEVVAHKKLDPISKEDVLRAFGKGNITVFTNSSDLLAEIERDSWENKTLVMMSSGNFDGVDFAELAQDLASQI
jgi:UDP-N-acetylmuramate: L-alanyl-gamma-D-glutamyl-meso-diaminopimelate ligase